MSAASNMIAGELLAGPVGAVVAGVKEAIFGLLDLVRSAGNTATSIVKDCVAAFRPMEIIKFTMALQDCRAVLGEMFVPIVQKATEVIRTIADWFLNLSTPVKQAIAVIAGITIVAGLAAGAFLAFAAALIPVALGIGLLTGPLGIIAAAFVGLAVLAYKSGYLGEALKLAQQAITFLVGGLQAAWDALAPVRAELSAAFDELRIAFAELFEAVKPIAAVLIGVVVIAIKTVVELIIRGLTMLVHAVTAVVKQIVSIVNALVQAFGMKGFKLPDLGGGDRSSFGMGQHAAEIGTDVGGLKTKLEQQIIERTSGGSSMEQTATNTAESGNTLKRIETQVSNILSRAANFAMNPVGEGLSAAKEAIFGP